MKFKTCFVLWHDRHPIYSVDFHSSGRLATAGADRLVKIWRLDLEEDQITVQFLSTLKGHQNPVNTVRFSPDGERLASAGDDGSILIWILDTSNEPRKSFIDESAEFNKENWIQQKYLKGPPDGIYDISWSPNSSYIMSGALDFTTAIWDPELNFKIQELSDHRQNVQGVAWDPWDVYVASLSSDRTCRIYKRTNQFQNKGTYRVSCHLLKKRAINTSKVYMYGDESVTTFFRRLCWSPDGRLLFTPCGIFSEDSEEGEIIHHCTYVYSRTCLSKPCMILPSPKKATVAVRCNPRLFKNLEHGEILFDLPYRIVFAVASLNAVCIYDTQHRHPLAIIMDAHYVALTDLAWSSDGHVLVISSSDGFCSVVHFHENDLGPMLEDAEFEKAMEPVNTARKTRRRAIKTSTTTPTTPQAGPTTTEPPTATMASSMVLETVPDPVATTTVTSLVLASKTATETVATPTEMMTVATTMVRDLRNEEVVSGMKVRKPLIKRRRKDIIPDPY